MPLFASAGTKFAVGDIIYETIGDNEVEVDGVARDIVGDIVIPSTVTNKDVTYSVTKIGNSAFNGCSVILTVELPNTITSIGNYAFFYCSRLSDIKIPDSVTEIGIWAFQGCTSLTSVVIGSSIEGIGEFTFRGCDSLNKIICKPIIPPTFTSYYRPEHTFSDISYSTATLYVPKEALYDYKKHKFWHKFDNILPMSDNVVLIVLDPVMANAEEGSEFNITAKVYPEEAVNKTLEWSSSDEEVATVDQNGHVTILKTGFCTITATATDGSGVSASCSIEGTVGIEDIYEEDTEETQNSVVFNLSGIRVLENADNEMIKNLTPGVYVIRKAGKTKKILVR